LAAGEDHHLFAGANRAGGDRSAEATEVEVGTIDPLHREAEVAEVAVATDVHRFEEVHQCRAAEPRHPLAGVDDVVPIQSADRDEV